MIAEETLIENNENKIIHTNSYKPIPLILIRL